MKRKVVAQSVYGRVHFRREATARSAECFGGGISFFGRLRTDGRARSSNRPSSTSDPAPAEGIKDAFPNAVLGPSVVAFEDGVPVAKALRQVAPGGTSARDPEHARR